MKYFTNEKKKYQYSSLKRFLSKNQRKVNLIFQYNKIKHENKRELLFTEIYQTY